MRRLLGAAASGVLVVAIAAAGYWAGTRAILPPQVPVVAPPAQTYQVQDGTVSRSFQVSVTAAWRAERTVQSNADGVITTVRHLSGDAAESGDVVASVNLEPVVVAEGTVPMFRALQRGVEGPDVAQFQELLRRKGFLKGPADGRFGRTTGTAADRWQRAIGAKRGAVRPETILFIPRLPARIEVLQGVGERVHVGDEFLRVLADRPEFNLLGHNPRSGR